MDIFEKLYSRYPVENLIFDENVPFEALQKELIEIKKINPYYAKKVLKKVIDSNLYPGDTDWMYDEYVSLLNEDGQDQYDKIDTIRYFFNTNENNRLSVDIFEKPNLISARSTTGFRTWEASLYLSEYLLKHQNEFQGKTVLELGCGTGICSLVLSKAQLPKKVYVTDGDSELVSNQLVKNFELNKINRDQNIIFQRLWWNEDSVPNDIDIVIGADITFDESLFEPLCQCLYECLNHCSKCLISATIRNEDTVAKFISICEQIGMNVNQLCKTESIESGRTLLAPIVIYEIYK